MDNICFREPGVDTLRVSVVLLSGVREDDRHRCWNWSMDMESSA
jgi:hypothetical protein